MLAAFFRNAADAMERGLVKDPTELGIIVCHLRAAVGYDEKQQFVEASCGEWIDEQISAAMQQGSFQDRWDSITETNPEISRVEIESEVE